MKLAYLVILLFAFGCDKMVTIDDHGIQKQVKVSLFGKETDHIVNEVPHTEIHHADDECDYSGFCTKCDFDLDCDFGYHFMCPGHEHVKFTTKTQYLITRYWTAESEYWQSPIWNRDVRDVIVSKGECK